MHAGAMKTVITQWCCWLKHAAHAMCHMHVPRIPHGLGELSSQAWAMGNCFCRRSATACCYFALTSGHVWSTLRHWRAQGWWKACLHDSGNTRSSPASTSRQVAHTCTTAPLAEQQLRQGTGCMAADMSEELSR